jgi:serine/threonine protein kinase
MPTRDSTLRHVAESIADGTRVDWDDTCRRHPEVSRQLSSLRAIEAIGLAHRSFTTPESSGDRLATGTADPRETVETADITTQSMAADPTLPRQWGHLEIRARIGAGGFGEIFRAYDPNLQKEVALKLPRPDRAPDELSSRRFLEEARKLAQVHHPNVLTRATMDAWACGPISWRARPWRRSSAHGISSVPRKPPSQGLTSVRLWLRFMPPVSSIGTSRPPTSCGKDAAESC